MPRKNHKAMNENLVAQILGRIRDAQAPNSVVQTAMQYLNEGLERLGMAYAVTGKAAQFEIGIRKRLKKINVALLNHDTSPEDVAKELAELNFDNKSPFNLSELGDFIFKDPRFCSTKLYKIVLFSVSALSPSKQTPFEASRLVRSKAGWLMMSPFFLLLDYLIKAKKKIQKAIDSGNTTVEIIEADDGSGKIHTLKSGKAPKMRPGNLANLQFLKDHHIEAAKYIALFVQEIRTLSPFRLIFRDSSGTTQAEFGSPSSIAETSSVSNSTPAPSARRSPSAPLSERESPTPEEDLWYDIPSSDVDNVSDVSMDSPSKSLKKGEEEATTSPTVRSLRWVAEAAVCNLLLLGLSPGLMGGMANLLYGALTVPSRIEIAVYAPLTEKVNAVKIKRWMASHKSEEFRMVGKTLYCRPRQHQNLDFEFVIAGPDAHRKHGYRIDIFLPSTSPLPPFDPNSLNHTQWVGSLPVVPFGFTLLHKLRIWANSVKHCRPAEAKQRHADDLFALLQQDRYLEYYRKERPWDDETLLNDDLRKKSKNRVENYIKKCVHGPASQAEWVRLGLA
ncbi:hypothetical protein BJ165DRAFT_1533218 [Panaeolus papilionaceus]|nr:hypothetical protein BJ165DRAFT_1533218 [Panaeolus papilionaceus]